MKTGAKKEFVARCVGKTDGINTLNKIEREQIRNALKKAIHNALKDQDVALLI